MLRVTLMYAGESWVGHRKKDSSFLAYQMEEDGPADVGRKNAGQILDDHELGYLLW